ncbi:MAG: sulfite exporter TauE/SafE family protein [Alphaproteobacteria bacterium]|nr:sulfite exporter TauE/SafE family protein [Alphaproteobacteria bacterium]
MPGGTDIILLLAGAFLAGIVTGLTGFGTALTAMALWLYAITPVLAAPLVAFCSLASHFFTVRRIWPDMDFRAAAPFVLGGLAGIPGGVWLLTRLSPDNFKLAVGAVLIIYPVFMLATRKPPSVGLATRPAELVIGVVSGICGGFAGLSGPILVIWSQLCQWSKQRARSVLQLINMMILMIAIVAYAIRGLVSTELLTLVALCVPATLCGSWIGLRLYERIDQESFKRVVLALLIASGLGLMLPRLL